MKLQFPTTEVVMAPPEGARRDKPAEWVVAQLWPEYGSRGLPKAIDPRVKVFVQVNHGRWLVECPWCPSAVIPSPEDRRFFCVECGNAAVGGRWVGVEWPDEATALEIEVALSVRPVEATRNWRHGEPPSNLRDENARLLRAVPKPVEVPYEPEGYDATGKLVRVKPVVPAAPAVTRP